MLSRKRFTISMHRKSPPAKKVSPHCCHFFIFIFCTFAHHLTCLVLAPLTVPRFRTSSNTSDKGSQASASSVALPMPPRATLPPRRNVPSPAPPEDSSGNLRGGDSSSDSSAQVPPARPLRSSVVPSPVPQFAPNPQSTTPSRNSMAPLPPRSQAPMQFVKPGGVPQAQPPSQPTTVSNLIDVSDEQAAPQPSDNKSSDPFGIFIFSILAFSHSKSPCLCLIAGWSSMLQNELQPTTAMPIPAPRAAPASAPPNGFPQPAPRVYPVASPVSAPQPQYPVAQPLYPTAYPIAPPVNPNAAPLVPQIPQSQQRFSFPVIPPSRPAGSGQPPPFRPPQQAQDPFAALVSLPPGRPTQPTLQQQQQQSHPGWETF